MSLIVKICGLSTEETLDAALAAGADMVGFNFFPKSPRFISVARAAELADRARGRAEIVVLTVDMAIPALREALALTKPDWVQLHGAEVAEHAAGIRRHTDVKVMKALGIGTAADLEAARSFAGVADRILLDAKPPKGADRPGGHGAPFDWSLLAGFDPGVPYLLGGGLTPANVSDALRATGAPGVDVSSGVETAPGKKDPALIRAFIVNARAAMADRFKERAAS
jgi:phosphoribosylanthranilate isomerase